MSTAILIAALAIGAAPAEADAAVANRIKKSPSPQTLATAQLILAQQVPQGIRAGAPRVVDRGGLDPRTADNGAALVDLIQQTVAPASWDINGGQGSIVFFGRGAVIVVRQTGERHQAIGNALQQMRK